MYSVLNLTDLHVNRLMVLYSQELQSIQGLDVAWVVFKPCEMIVKGRQGQVILHVDETK